MNAVTVDNKGHIPLPKHNCGCDLETFILKQVAEAEEEYRAE